MSTKLVMLPDDQYGMGIYSGKDIICTSQAVSQTFGKKHDKVLRDIDNAISNLTKSGEIDFSKINFIQSFYKDDKNRKQPMYLLTRDGFTLLVFGYSGTRAMKFKVAYINRFNEMEDALKDRQQARMECRLLTDAIKFSHDSAKPYHFSNEMNMLLQIVTGKNAKQLKKEYDLPDNATVRDYLSQTEIKTLAALQPVAAFLNANKIEYQERKCMLKDYAEKLKYPKLQKAV